MTIPTDGDPGDDRDRRRHLLAAVRSLRTALLALGVDVVWADYAGAGGTGRVENVAYFNSVQPGQVFSVGATAQAGVEALLHTLVDARHPAWSEGEGAHGTFAWDLVHETLEHEHRRRRPGSDEVSVHEGFDVEAPDGPDPTVPKTA